MNTVKRSLFFLQNSLWQMKLVISKNDLLWIQTAGFLKDVQAVIYIFFLRITFEVNDIWGKLVERCQPPTLKDVQEAQQSQTTSSTEKPIEEQLPSLKRTFQKTTSLDTISIVCSQKNGLSLAK